MKLFFKKIGEGSPLLIVHGLFGSADNWGTLAKKLALSHTVYLIDLRNHGRSPHSELMNYDLMADDLFELINEEKIDKPILLGHSMGGKAALEFSEKYPNILQKLIIADIGIKAYPMHHDIILKGLQNVNLDKINTRQNAQLALSEFVKEIGIQQFLLKNLYWIEKGKLAWRMNLSSITKNIHEVLKEITIKNNHLPTLFLRGELSSYIVEGDYPELLKKFPNSEIKTIKDAGHWLHAENPKDFLEEVVNFIN